MEQQFTVEELKKLLDEVEPQTEVPAAEEVLAELETPVAEELIAEAEIPAESVAAEMPTEPEIPVVEEVIAESEMPAEPEMPVEAEMPAEPEIPVVEEVIAEPEVPEEPEVPAEAEMPAELEIPVGEEVIAEPEVPEEPEVPATEEAVSATEISTNLVIVKKESGKSAFCAEIDGRMLGEEPGTKYPVLVTGNNIVYVKGNCLVSQNIGTGEKRNDEMDEMVLYTITGGMKENIEANRRYSDNSVLFKWLLAKLLCIKEDECAIAGLNEYFDFIQLGISASSEDGRITFKAEEGGELLIAEVFERLATIRA